MASHLRIVGVISGSWGRKEIDIPLLNTSLTGAPYQVPRTTLPQNADATLLVPAGAKGLIIVPDVANLTEWRIKGVGGDTGHRFGPADPVVVTANSAVADGAVILRPVAGPLVLDQVVAF